jgi:hypothetical protein
VSLNKSAVTLLIADTEQLTATVAPTNATDQSVTWNSSDDNIATVSTSGLVTAVAAGAATITVTTTDGSHTATCEVTVTLSLPAITDTARLQLLSVNGTDIPLVPNITEYRFTLPCDSAIARVQAAGEGTVSVTLPNGTGVITLNEPTDSVVTIIATGAGLDSAKYTLHLVHPISRLVHQVWNDVLVLNLNPETNGGITLSNNTQIQWQKNGYATDITTPHYYLTDAEVKSTDIYNVRLLIYDKEIPSCLFEHAERLDAALIAYPNPTRSIVTVALPQDSEIEIYSIDGTLMYSVPAVAGNTTINLGTLPAGIYLLKAAGQVVRVVVTSN